jgi:Ni/Co efflux regulator RcnB
MKRFIIAAAALSLLGGAAAMAQPNGDRDRDGIPNKYDQYNNGRPNGDRDRDGIPNRYDQRNNTQRRNGDRDRDGIPNRYDAQPNRYNYSGHYYDRFRGPVYYYPRGYTYRSWTRGQALPRAYLASPYYVDNWSYYRLAPPPYGHRYVRVGNDILLTAIATGLIANVISGVFY